VIALTKRDISSKGNHPEADVVCSHENKMIQNHD